MSIAIIVSILAIIVGIFFSLKKVFQRYSNEHKKTTIPGPPRDPDGTNLKSFAIAGSFKKFAEDMHSQYGGLVQFYLPDKTVSIAEPEYLKKIIKIGSRPKKLFSFLEGLVGKDNIQVFDTARAKSVRNHVMRTIGHSFMESKFDVVLTLFQDQVKLWEQQQKNKKIEVQKELLILALRTVMRLMIGKEMEMLVDFEKFTHCYNAAMSLSLEGQFQPLPKEKEKQLREATDFLHDTYREFIKTRRDILKDESCDHHSKTLLDVLLTEDDPYTQEPYTEEKLLSHTIAFTIAAYHTTIVAVSWTIFSLTQYPEVQNSVQKEVDEKLQGRIPQSFEELNELHYLAQVVKESMRLYPPGPFAARITEEDTKIGNYIIPRDTTIFVSISSVHINPKYWPEPLKFDPSRFSENAPKIHRQAFIPFGLGIRYCPGDQMSMCQIKLLLALLMQKFSFKLAMDVKDVIPVEKFALWAKNDIVVGADSRTQTNTEKRE